MYSVVARVFELHLHVVVPFELKALGTEVIVQLKLLVYSIVDYHEITH